MESIWKKVMKIRLKSEYLFMNTQLVNSFDKNLEHFFFRLQLITLLLRPRELKSVDRIYGPIQNIVPWFSISHRRSFPFYTDPDGVISITIKSAEIKSNIHRVGTFLRWGPSNESWVLVATLGEKMNS